MTFRLAKGDKDIGPLLGLAGKRPPHRHDAAGPVVLTHARIVSPSGIGHELSVVIDDGRITEIGPFPMLDIPKNPFPIAQAEAFSYMHNRLSLAKKIILMSLNP